MARKFKYARLSEYLQLRASEGRGTFTLSFAKVDELVRDVKGGLPDSAYNAKYSWWTNNDDKGRRSQAKAWMDTDYHAFPDHVNQTVTFKKNT